MKKIDITSEFTIYQNRSELAEEDAQLLNQAEKAGDKAYAPYSEFFVGASVLLENGEIVLGSNQENAAYPSGMCAERVAIWNAASRFPGIKIKKIFIVARSANHPVDKPVSPCGACRQTIAEYEFKQKEPITIFFTGESGKIVKTASVNGLLPFAFDNSLL